jgi:hypothetical protein
MQCRASDQRFGSLDAGASLLKPLDLDVPRFAWSSLKKKFFILTPPLPFPPRNDEFIRSNGHFCISFRKAMTRFLVEENE